MIDQVTGFLGASWHRFSLLDRTLLLVILVLAKLEFNVGYDVSPKAVQRMVESAFIHLEKDSASPIAFSHGFDLHPVAAADYSVTWCLFYHTKELRQLITTRYRINAALVEAAAEHGIQLATPVLISAPAALDGLLAAGPAEPVAAPAGPSE